MPIYEFAVDERMPYELGAFLLASLSGYAHKGRSYTLEERHEAYCQSACRLYADQAASSGLCETLVVRPWHILGEPDKYTKVLCKLESRLVNAMHAGRMGMGFILVGRGEYDPSRFGPRGLTVNALAKLVGDDIQYDPDRVEREIFRPFKPVLHIAAALQAVLTAGQPKHGKTESLDWRWLFQNTAVPRQIIDISNEFDAEMRKCSQLNRDEDTIVRIALR